MHLSVETISRLGGYTGGPVKKTVKWNQDGEDLEADVHVRPMSYHTAIGDAANAGEPREMVVARRLSVCLCAEDGAPLFRLSDITGLDDDGQPVMVKNDQGKRVERGAMNVNLTTALLALVGEVSGLGKQKPKKRSAIRKQSGTS